MQKQKLFDDEKQKKHDRQASAEEILQAMRKAYDAQRDQGIMKCRIENAKLRISESYSEFLNLNFAFYGYRPVALTARASDSKSEGWGFKSLLACHHDEVNK